jgi:tellurite resistance protein TerC
MSDEVAMWIGFNVVVIVLLIFDLNFWIALSLLFNLGIYFWRDSGPALEFLTCYLIEKSLSVDNLFVFLLIFSYFAVPALYQHKVLFWGILGAIVMRLAFIMAGVTLIDKVHWVIYIFGAFLVLMSIRMAVRKETEIQPEKNPVLRLFRRFVPITDCYEDDKFFVRRVGRNFATPLFIVVLVIETTDVIFAVDSVPAALSISLDPFIVYSSNVCAILGLRALYFALAGVMRMFKYLNHGLVVVLFFVGIKMLISEAYEMPVGIALGVVATILLVSIVLSIIRSDNREIEVTGEAAPEVKECDADGLSDISSGRE